MKRQAANTILFGQAGVYQVASQLLLRGMNVSFPAVDVGTDLYVGPVRIQVKASRLRSHPAYPAGGYFFQLSKIARSKDMRIVKVERDFIDECDFLVCWGADENRFWIIPSHVVQGHALIALGPATQHIDVDMVHVKSLLDSGMSSGEVAKHLGLSYETLRRRMRTGHTESKYTLCKAARSGEGRWDLISEKLAAPSQETPVIDNVIPLVKEG